MSMVAVSTAVSRIDAVYAIEGAMLDRRVYIVRETRSGGVAQVEAHITGTVWKIEVAVGDQVAEGDTVAILESMKMEMPSRPRTRAP